MLSLHQYEKVEDIEPEQLPTFTFLCCPNTEIFRPWGKIETSHDIQEHHFKIFHSLAPSVQFYGPIGEKTSLNLCTKFHPWIQLQGVVFARLVTGCRKCSVSAQNSKKQMIGSNRRRDDHNAQTVFLVMFLWCPLQPMSPILALVLNLGPLVPPPFPAKHATVMALWGK